MSKEIVSPIRKKCPKCKGDGTVYIQHQGIEPVLIDCPLCEGLGVPLRTSIEEQFDSACELDGNDLRGDERYINFEEEDYEV